MQETNEPVTVGGIALCGMIRTGHSRDAGRAADERPHPRGSGVVSARDVVQAAWDAVDDRRTYRTELDRSGAGGWRLTVDAREVARIDAGLMPSAAQDWARSQLGEGVEFFPGNVHGTYWVANPEQERAR